MSVAMVYKQIIFKHRNLTKHMARSYVQRKMVNNRIKEEVRQDIIRLSPARNVSVIHRLVKKWKATCNVANKKKSGRKNTTFNHWLEES